MAAGTMSKMPTKSLLVPDNLNVKGRGLSPRPTTPTSPTTPQDSNMMSLATSSRSSMSEEESEKSEEYTVLDGVREMNQILVRQIETLRLKIKVDEKNYDNEKAKLVESKDSAIKAKEYEIDDLRESLVSRDDKIHQLVKASEEKDRTIESKCEEIEDLKKMVRQTKEYAQKIQKQVGRVRHQREKLEADPLYKQQNEEIARLTEELETLRSRLATMEQELARAMKVIEQQNEKLKTMDTERVVMQAKFREDLDRASKAMRQEVERMREVMRQNYEEMKILREQNKEMHNDVRAIKEMLRSSRAGPANQETVTGLQRPLTASPQPPSYSKQTHGQTTAVPPKGPGKMVGGNIISQSTTKRNLQGVQGTHLQTQNPQPVVRESSHFASRNGRGSFKQSPTRVSTSTDVSGPHSTNTTSRLSPDPSARTLHPGQTPRFDNKMMSVQNLHVPAQNNAPKNKNLPPICSVKEGVPAPARQPSGRGAKSAVRRGSAISRR